MNRKSACILLLLLLPLTMAMNKSDLAQKLAQKPYGVIEERDGSDTLTRQIVRGGGGHLWQILADGSSQYLHEDARGNTVMVTEGAGSPTAAAGDVLERVTYDAYGKPIFQDANNQDKFEAGGPLLASSDFGNTLLFMGRWYDPETGSRGTSPNNDRGGLYDFGGRYLNPDEGRFITRSPVSDKVHEILEAQSRYGFAGHAPVSRMKGDFSRGHRPDRKSAGPMPQTREHILLGRQVGVPAAKLRGYRTVSDITLKRGVVHGSAHGHLDYIKKVGDPATFHSHHTIGDITLKRGVVGGKGHGQGFVDAFVSIAAAPATAPGGEGEIIIVGSAPAPAGGEGEIIIVGSAPVAAAIAIPNLLDARKSGNESSASESLNHLRKAYDLNPNAHSSDPNGEFWFEDLIPGAASSSTRDSEGWYCYDPPWSRPMCCGYSGEVEVCVYF